MPPTMGNKMQVTVYGEPQQLELFCRNEASLSHELAEIIHEPVDLSITDNTSSLVSFRWIPGRGVRLRLHHMFLRAPREVIVALAWWMKRRRRSHADRVIDEYIRTHHYLVRDKPPRKVTLRTQGIHRDLQSLYDEVNTEYFDGKVCARITWGKYGAHRKRKRSIRFGSYNARQNVIRIHPALDSSHVPVFFLKFIVYHEMLHAYLGVNAGGRSTRRIHTAEFYCLERRYTDYDAAVAWQQDPKNLRFLLRR
ncbi:MAG TPA: hypothetical protein PKY35_07125 [Candidatus Hydrogenedentes bacterium]|nr:hypothetical protein [Candidatus Hydrogenedentota bacterium]HOL76787.1 hypothetical protein [Candidatus Hydrogenedentota bacterium]HPO85736.1 hypothetical protein [Candidatus Hydrogenedentota bacterium]